MLTQPGLEREAVRGAVTHLAERRSVFKLADLEREALTRVRGHGVTIADIRRELARDRDLVIAGRGDAAQARVTTVRAVTDERAIVDLAHTGRGHGPTLAVSFAGRGLGDDQERVARHVLELAREAHVKVVLVGDRGQHRAVEAGSPFELLIERRAVAVARLDVVRRQQDAALREAVVAAAEAPGTRQAVALLERQGRILEIDDRRARHQQIAADFLTDGGPSLRATPSAPT